MQCGRVGGRPLFQKPWRSFSGAFLCLFERYAVADVYGDGIYLEIIFLDVHADYTGMTVQGLALIKDEITDAVIDKMAFEFFYSLKCVSMVADEDIGTCMY